MAHFAELDSDNTVLRVLVVANAKITDESGVEQEFLGVQYLRELFGADTSWVQTSYNSNFRKHYAAPGGKYYPNLDVFLPPKPYASWGVNPETLEWQAPVPYPSNSSQIYFWDEASRSWKLNKALSVPV